MEEDVCKKIQSSKKTASVPVDLPSALWDRFMERLAWLETVIFDQITKQKTWPRAWATMFVIVILNPGILHSQANVETFRAQTSCQWAQQLINLEIPVLVRSLKSSNVELGLYLDGRLFKCYLRAAANR